MSVHCGITVGRGYRFKKVRILAWCDLLLLKRGKLFAWIRGAEICDDFIGKILSLQPSAMMMWPLKIYI